MDLDSRKSTILRAIIVEYVDSAEPIGSEMLVQKHHLGVKSATVRSEMSELSDLGYLEQPHTSAGRIPSDQGYRYFVDHMIVPKQIDEQTRAKLKERGAEGDALQVVLRDTVGALSRLTHLMSVATTVRDVNLTVRNAIVSGLNSSQALLVLILSNGQVENRMVECSAGLTLEEIGLTNTQLQTSVVGRTLRSLSRLKSQATTGQLALDRFGATLTASIRSMAKDLTRGAMLVEGEEFMFAQPEFQRDVASLAALLEDLKDSELLYESIAPSESAKSVTIGRENRHIPLQQLSIIRDSFYVGGNEVGVIALIGPTRMQYATGIPIVNFTARALSESLTRFFG